MEGEAKTSVASASDIVVHGPMTPWYLVFIRLRTARADSWYKYDYRVLIFNSRFLRLSWHILYPFFPVFFEPITYIVPRVGWY